MKWAEEAATSPAPTSANPKHQRQMERVPEMKNESNIWADSYSRMDMVKAFTLGLVVGLVFMAVSVLMGAI